MSTNTELFVAAPSNATKENASTPRIDHLDEDLEIEESRFNSFKASFLILGLLLGFVIQFSSLGANFLVVTTWGKDVAITKSKAEIITFSLLWPLFTSSMAIVMLASLCNIVASAYNDLSTRNTVTTEKLLEGMILHMEYCFVGGALAGVCLAWTMTDIVLGMKAQMTYSDEILVRALGRWHFMYNAVTLVIALVWCHSMMARFSKSNKISEEKALIFA